MPSQIDIFNAGYQSRLEVEKNKESGGGFKLDLTTSAIENSGCWIEGMQKAEQDLRNGMVPVDKRIC